MLPTHLEPFAPLRIGSMAVWEHSMARQREPRSFRQFLLSAVDHLGRVIDSDVLAAAERIGPRVLIRGEKLLGDPAVALTLLEEVAASTTSAMHAKLLRGEPPIRDLDGYLYLAFMRRVRDKKRRGPALQSLTDLEWKAGSPRSGLSEIERNVLLDELLGTCDTVTVDIVIRRYSGQGWREIGTASGISATAARLRFRKAMLRIRRAIGPQKQST
jgi:DNA-directed RNA polymerase specialized sigma24 family protein